MENNEWNDLFRKMDALRVQKDKANKDELTAQLKLLFSTATTTNGVLETREACFQAVGCNLVDDGVINYEESFKVALELAKVATEAMDAFWMAISADEDDSAAEVAFNKMLSMCHSREQVAEFLGNLAEYGIKLEHEQLYLNGFTRMKELPSIPEEDTES